MGSAGIRAVSLCDKDLIDRLNHYFVPLVVELNYRITSLNPIDTPSGRQMIETFAPYFRRRPALLQTFVMTSDGKVVNVAEPMGQTADVISNQTAAAIRELGLKPGESIAPYVSNAHDPNASLQLRVVIRYNDSNVISELRQLHPLSNTPGYNVYPAALTAATRDWVSLTPEQCAQMLPVAGAGVGTAFDVSDGVARTVLSHFRPEPSLMEPDGDTKAIARVQKASLRGTVTSVSGDTARAELRGRLEMYQPGLRPESAGESPSDKNRVALDVVGYVDWNPKTRAITHLSMSTANATYTGYDGKPTLGYQGVAYLVPVERH